jgi:hypothetical protein
MMVRQRPRLAQAVRRVAPFAVLLVWLPLMAAAKPMTPTLTGQVGIFWSHGGTLRVRVKMTGLAPNSRHPAHIHQGSCQQIGDMEYPLHDVVANRDGVGLSITRLTGFQPIPTGVLVVHQGPDMTTTTGEMPIACASTFALGHATDVAAHEWLTMHPLAVMAAMMMP